MRLQDIQVGKYYRLNNTGGQFTQYYGWVKVLEIYKKGQWGNLTNINRLKMKH
jgi:hypothetical protein